MIRFDRPRLLTAVAFSLLAQPGQAQVMDHSAMGAPAASAAATPALPREPGQGAFAAIAEIVTILAQDPATDWQRVDIAGLRAHLVDMDNLVTETVVSQRDVKDGIEISIEVTDRDASAALRMVPAHGPVLKGETRWDTALSDQGDRLIWTVTGPGEADQIRALGFFGLMATGDHHRAHHLALARGVPIH